MRAAVLHQPKDLKIMDIPEREVGPHEVKIRVKSVGICGTDVLVYEGSVHSKPPVVLGHEFAGVVVETGPEVKRLKAGDRVSGRGSWECGECDGCRSASRHCEIGRAHV